MPQRQRPLRVLEDGDFVPVAAPIPAPLRRVLDGLRRGLRPIQDPSCAGCGYTLVAEYASLVVGEHGRARWEGFKHCRSVWACPRCGGNIKVRRAKEVTYAVERHGRTRAAMLTLTVRHGWGDDLEGLRRGLADAWAAFTRGAPWRRFCEAMGVFGFIRALEVTHGEHGFHPHLHLLVFLRDAIAPAEIVETTDDEGRELERWLPATTLPCGHEWQDGWKECPCCQGTGESANVWAAVKDEDGLEQLPPELDGVRQCARCKGDGRIARLRRCAGRGCESCHYQGRVSALEWMQRRWRAVVVRVLGAVHEPDEEHGLLLSPIHRVAYLAKLGLELSDPGVKKGRHKGRAPLEVAADFVAGSRRDGKDWSQTTKRDAGIWRAYRLGMFGAHQLTWSHGLKRHFGIRDRADEELCQDDEPARTDRIIARVLAAHVAELRRLSVTVEVFEDRDSGEVRTVTMPALVHLQEVGEDRGGEAVNGEVLRILCGEVKQRKEEPSCMLEPPPG